MGKDKEIIFGLLIILIVLVAGVLLFTIRNNSPYNSYNSSYNSPSGYRTDADQLTQASSVSRGNGRFQYRDDDHYEYRGDDDD